MLSPEGIRIAKGEVLNTTKRTVPFIEHDPKEILLSRREDTIFGYASGIIVTKKIKLCSIKINRL